MDCSKTETFLHEWKRMCKANKCNTCVLYGVHGTCKNFILTKPEKAVEIVQEWSDSHPVRTRLIVLKEKFPKLIIDEDGLPSEICAGILYGFECYDGMNCVDCWNTPIEDDNNA